MGGRYKSKNDDLSTFCSSDYVESAHITTTDQSDNIENVTWFGNQEYNRDFVTNFVAGIRVTDMSGRAKLFIHGRYLGLFNKYRKKYKTSRSLNNFARLIITLGAILIPALLTIDDEISDRSKTSQAIYYSTFSLGLLVSIVNAIAELSQVAKRFYANATTHQLLEQEGWHFLLLRGVYKKYDNHRQCWQTFLHRVEKIHQSAVSSGLLLYRQQDPVATKKSTGSVLDGTKQSDGDFLIPEELGPLEEYQNELLKESLGRLNSISNPDTENGDVKDTIIITSH